METEGLLLVEKNLYADLAVKMKNEFPKEMVVV
jgi:hypothetical protein